MKYIITSVADPHFKNADPDPAPTIYQNADPDPAPTIFTNADPDPAPTIFTNADPDPDPAPTIFKNPDPYPAPTCKYFPPIFFKNERTRLRFYLENENILWRCQVHIAKATRN